MRALQATNTCSTSRLTCWLTLTTRAVVPLLPLGKAPKPARTLNPVFDIGGVQHAMVTQYLSAIRRRELGSHVADLTNEASTIVNALDCLFQGV